MTDPTGDPGYQPPPPYQAPPAPNYSAPAPPPPPPAYGQPAPPPPTGAGWAQPGYQQPGYPPPGYPPQWGPPMAQPRQFGAFGGGYRAAGSGGLALRLVLVGVSAMVCLALFATGDTFVAAIIGFGVVVRLVMILALYQRRR